MTKDYAKSTYNDRKGASHTINLLIGVILGLGIASVVYWSKEHTHGWQTSERAPLLTSTATSMVKATASTAAVRHKKITKKPTHKTVAAKSKNKDPAVSSQPHFDFYTALPQMEVLITEDKTKSVPTSKEANLQRNAPTKTVDHVDKKAELLNIGETEASADSIIAENPAAAESARTASHSSDEMTKISKQVNEAVKARYIVQVASFADFGEADHIKAQLALKGFEVQLKLARTSSGRRYRVVVGPFSVENQAFLAQEELRRHHLKSLVIGL